MDILKISSAVKLRPVDKYQNRARRPARWSRSIRMLIVPIANAPASSTVNESSKSVSKAFMCRRLFSGSSDEPKYIAHKLCADVTVLISQANDALTTATLLYDTSTMITKFTIRTCRSSTPFSDSTGHTSDKLALSMRNCASLFEPLFNHFDYTPESSNRLTMTENLLSDVDEAPGIIPPNLISAMHMENEVVGSSEQGSYPPSNLDDIPLLLRDSGTLSSNENNISFEDVAAIDFAVQSTRGEQLCEAGLEATLSNEGNSIQKLSLFQDHSTSHLLNWTETHALDVNSTPDDILAQPRNENKSSSPVDTPSPSCISTRGEISTKRPNRRREESRKIRGSTAGTRMHGCTLCPSRFKMRGDFQRHIKTVHEGKKSFTCATCGRTFGHSGHLNRHIESMHLKLRRHACQLCGDKFFQASHLQSHIIHVHDSKKLYDCC